MRSSQVVNRWLLVVALLINVTVSVAAAESVRTTEIVCAPAKSVATVPRLVIETGRHRAHIRELLFTADGRKLISVSDDKTIRVWGLSPDGQPTRLIRTIRGYMAEGRVGALYAAALSPPTEAGRHQWLAVGGFLPNRQRDRYAIRLHDYPSGEVVALLYGHRNVINSLSFSPDGRWLASVGKDHTVQLWEMSALNGHTLTTAAVVLTGHTQPIYDVAWSADGARLATASYDHTVGLWDTSQLADGRATLISRLRGHRQPVRSVAFHPTQAILVSGGKDETIRHWRIHDGHALGVFARTGNWVAALAFAPDGTTLLAGRMGGADNPKRLTLYRYPEGKAQLTFTEHDNVVLATAFHPHLPWIASGGGNRKEILLWNRTTGTVVTQLRGKGQTIWAVGFDQNGQWMSWGQTPTVKPDNRRGPLEQRFDLTSLRHHDGGLPASEAVRALERVGALSFSVERGGPHAYPYRLHVRRGHRRISTIERDASTGYRHTAYSFTPDGQSVVSGGLNGTLTLYALDGTPRATLVGHTGEIKALAVSADGQWLVSGASDQTLKLWSLANLPTTGMTSIAPTLTLFPTKEAPLPDKTHQREWVAWTPDGYFAASHHGAGAKLIGYSLNQGRDQTAKYVSVDQLYDVFYRPDRVRSALDHKWPKKGASPPDVSTVIAGGLPPCIQFLTPQSPATVKTDALTVRVGLLDQGGGIGKVVWKVNGVTYQPRRPWLSASKPSPQEAAFSVILAKQFPLVSGPNTIEVIAYNARNELASEPHTLTVNRQAPTLEPTLHLLAIGIDDYRNRRLRLNYAKSDAEAVSQALRRIGAPLFKAIRVIQVPDQVIWSNLETTFQAAANDIAAHDVFVLFLAGHGVTLDGQYYFLLQDAQDGSPAAMQRLATCPDDPDKARGICHAVLRQPVLQHWLSLIPARKSLVLLDTCESGSFPLSPLPLVTNLVKQTALDRLTRGTGRAIIAAATAREPALEGYRNHGLFTYALLEAMRRADAQTGDRDGNVSILELAMYVDKRVPALSLRNFQIEQFTHFYAQGRDFLIGVAD